MIITESEKDKSDTWLINDISKNSTNKIKQTNKRKTSHIRETDDEGSDSNDIMNAELFASLNFHEKAKESSGLPKSPLSKKRFIETSSEDEFQTNDITDIYESNSSDFKSTANENDDGNDEQLAKFKSG